jgi:hypothetical protein
MLFWRKADNGVVCALACMSPTWPDLKAKLLIDLGGDI